MRKLLSTHRRAQRSCSGAVDGMAFTSVLEQGLSLLKGVAVVIEGVTAIETADGIALAAPVVVAATSGVSAVISPRGTIEQRTRVFERESLSATLPQLTSRTVADHVGELPEWVLTGWALIAFVALSVRRRAA